MFPKIFVWTTIKYLYTIKSYIYIQLSSWDTLFFFLLFVWKHTGHPPDVIEGKTMSKNMTRKMIAAGKKWVVSKKWLFLVSTMKYIYIHVTALKYIFTCFMGYSLFSTFFRWVFPKNDCFRLYHEIYIYTRHCSYIYIHLFHWTTLFFLTFLET